MPYVSPFNYPAAFTWMYNFCGDHGIRTADEGFTHEAHGGIIEYPHAFPLVGLDDEDGVFHFASWVREGRKLRSSCQFSPDPKTGAGAFLLGLAGVMTPAS
jgi:hypothetical protein